MGFNEKVHAFIAAKFYVRLTEQFGERGRKAFVHGTQYYAEQRGRRMAQRAIRDGMELTYETYLQYGEWVNSQDTIEGECSNQATVQSTTPDYVNHITRCPWHTQFKEMGLVEAGHEYCQHLDNSIARGFNPYIVYEVYQTLHKSPYCIHCIKNANIEPGKKLSKKAEYLKDWDYHCAHSYWAYTEVTDSIFGLEGRKISTAVLNDIAETYGKEMADKLMEYKGTNFNVCD